MSRRVAFLLLAAALGLAGAFVAILAHVYFIADVLIVASGATTVAGALALLTRPDQQARDPGFRSSLPSNVSYFKGAAAPPASGLSGRPLPFPAHGTDEAERRADQAWAELEALHRDYERRTS